MDNFDRELAELDARLDAMFIQSKQQDQRIALLRDQVDDVKSKMNDMSDRLDGLSQFRFNGSSTAHFDVDLSEVYNR